MTLLPTQETMEDKYYTTSEVMKLLNINKDTIMKMRKANQIKYIEFPKRKFKYLKTEVEKIMKEGIK